MFENILFIRQNVAVLYILKIKRRYVSFSKNVLRFLSLLQQKKLQDCVLNNRCMERGRYNEQTYEAFYKTKPKGDYLSYCGHSYGLPYRKK